MVVQIAVQLAGSRGAAFTTLAPPYRILNALVWVMWTLKKLVPSWLSKRCTIFAKEGEAEVAVIPLMANFSLKCVGICTAAIAGLAIIAVAV
jgi:hypothetical protein